MAATNDGVCWAGNVSLTIRSIFCGASLCALNKKDGGIRPTAVGCRQHQLDVGAPIRDDDEVNVNHF